MSINCAKKKDPSELGVMTGEKKHRKKKNIKKKVRARPLGSAEVSSDITVLGKEISVTPTCIPASLTPSYLSTSTNVRKRICQLNVRATSVNHVRLKHITLSSSQSLWDVSHNDVSCKTKSGQNSLVGKQGYNTAASDHVQSCSVQPLNIKGGKKPVVPLLTAIRPENEKSEKERFFQARFCYNPVFVYRNPADVDALERFSSPSDKYLPQAILIMERALEKHGHYENFEEKTGGKILNRPEIVSIIKRYLRQEDLEDEIRLNLSEDLLSRASMTKGRGKATLNVRIVNLREFWVEGLLRHEIGTHYLRSCNNKHQIWFNWKKRKELSLKHFNPTEEGLASLHSVLLRKDPCLWRSALLYYTAYKAAYLSFKDLFRDLGKFVSDAQVRWDYCMRAKRGQGDTSVPGGFCKDQVYLDGALELLKHRNSIDFQLLLSLGKIAYQDVDRLKELADLGNTRIPGFMRDYDNYKRCLDRVATVNGLTEEVLAGV
ncbi:microtubule-associated tyrosine carboxypeptidase-like isoform X1 [Liolophura sinensis]|uniref:microtubule-associated tyrosine carboxypeptidase-like isoform X1 n=2 Tax=Liolophura sinensis TaxID=3198878 RepID=UPI003158A428